MSKGEESLGREREVGGDVTKVMPGAMYNQAHKNPKGGEIDIIFTRTPCLCS